MQDLQQTYSDLMNEIATANILGKDTTELKKKLNEVKKTYRVCGTIDKDPENAFMNSNNRNRDDCIKFFNGSNTINYGDEIDDPIVTNKPDIIQKDKPIRRKKKGIAATLTDPGESSHVQREKAKKISEEHDETLEDDPEAHINLLILAKSSLPDTEDDYHALARNVLDVSDMIHVYDPEELSIIDANTGEFVSHICAGLFEGKTVQLDEVFTVADRIKAAYRMVKMHNLMQRKLMIALNHHSTQDVLVRRAERLALHMIKNRLTGGRHYEQLSFSERQRIDELVKSKRSMIHTLALALLPRVREIEQTRLNHRVFTKTKGEPA